MSSLRLPTSFLARTYRAVWHSGLFHVYYTPSFAPWRRDLEQWNPRTAHHAKLIDDYENMPRDTLRWRVVANTATKEAPKAVMRERLRRRVREAFRGALNQAGYDRDGRRLDSFKTKDRSSKDIKGTLEIYCRTRAGLDLDFAEIVREAANVVHKVHESWNSSSGTRADG